jgi:hypothetical protein
MACWDSTPFLARGRGWYMGIPGMRHTCTVTSCSEVYWSGTAGYPPSNAVQETAPTDPTDPRWSRGVVQDPLCSSRIVLLYFHFLRCKCCPKSCQRGIFTPIGFSYDLRSLGIPGCFLGYHSLNFAKTIKVAI